MRTVFAITISCLLLACGGVRAANPAAPAEEKLSFLFFSDTQADPETGDYSDVGGLITQAVSQAKPSLVIFGGDTVNNGADPDEWQAFWKFAATPLSGVTTAAVPGNHDDCALLAEQFNYPASAPANPRGGYGGYFYSFDAGPVHFIMLDSNSMGAANQADIDWLRDDLTGDSARQASWRIVVMHHPMWPPVNILKDVQRADTMREAFLPLLEEYGADLILCGHQHIYARSLPMRGGGAAPDGDGIIQIMTASGGKEQYTVSETDNIAVFGETPAYLAITADSLRLDITASDTNGEPFDTISLTR